MKKYFILAAALLCSGSLFAEDTPSSIRARVVEAAREYIGTPYSQVDCGKLTRLALEAVGYASGTEGCYDKNDGNARLGAGFSRCADDQYWYAEHAVKHLRLLQAGEEPQAGDLIFFNWATSQSGIAYYGITHVGLVAGPTGDGDLYIIHASASRGVVQDRLKGWIGDENVAGFGRIE